MATPRADQTFRVTLLCVAAAAVLFAAGAFVRYGTSAGVSTLLGGATAVLNLTAMRRIFANLVDGTAEGDLAKGRRWGSLAVLKLFVLLAGVAVLLSSGLADGVPFVVGYLALPVGIAAGAALSRE